MKPNKKKPLRLKNRTKFFDPNKDKTFVQFSSPESYNSQQMKIEGYETRLYWQYKYCESVEGQTFYYTLTYADKNLPEKYGTKCFDYEDLRDLLTGGFRKILLRKYGTRFKYFVGAELGEGQGKRGYHNNPHYHILFFLEPFPHTMHKRTRKTIEDGVYLRNTKYHKKGDKKYKKIVIDEEIYIPYTKINSRDFRHLVRHYWQGFDQDTDGRHDFITETKYGIAKEGDNLGKVYDFRAITYVAKYVCKDIRLKMKEVNIRQLLNLKLRNSLKTDLDFHKDFLQEVVYPMYNIPKNAKGEWQYDDVQMMVKLLPDLAKIFNSLPSCTAEEFFCKSSLINDVKQLCYKLKLWPKYNNFLNERITILTDAAIKEWRNRYCNKCRISQGVGDYAIDFVKDKLDPLFEIDTKDGKKLRPMNLYYYRKMYTTVIYPTLKDFFGNYHMCNPIRVLNKEGIDYKVNQLKKRIDKKALSSKNDLEIILGRPELFEEMKASDINTEVSCSHQYFVERYNELLKDNINIYERYAEYKLVYEDRYYAVKDMGTGEYLNAPCINRYDDYAKFLMPSAYSISRSDLLLDMFLEGNNKDYLPYSEHPYFLRYMCIFGVLDMCADYFFIQKDNKRQKDAEERERVRKFHVKHNLKLI